MLNQIVYNYTIVAHLLSFFPNFVNQKMNKGTPWPWGLMQKARHIAVKLHMFLCNFVISHWVEFILLSRYWKWSLSLGGYICSSKFSGYGRGKHKLGKSYGPLLFGCYSHAKSYMYPSSYTFNTPSRQGTLKYNLATAYFSICLWVR